MALKPRTIKLLEDYFTDKLPNKDVSKLVGELVGELNKAKRMKVQDILYSGIRAK